MNEWDELKDWLEQGDFNYLPPFENPFFLRFAVAVSNGVSGRDLAALVRGILRAESERSGGQRILLKVPKQQSWPTLAMYQEAGVVALEENENTFLVYAEPWAPNWLNFKSGEEPDKPLYGLVKRSHLKEVQGDPFLPEVGRHSYRCGAQRDAVRSLLTAPEDATVLINLPTGTGKSLCGQLPALMMSKQEGVTVVIVPTVALALDQERALQPLVDHPMAYFSSSSRQMENEIIKEKIMDGSQRIVFTSPESVLQSLNFPIQIAAQRGFLKMLVIDEAHTVDGWGENFRPAFQELSGWRRMILRKSAIPFRTVLLSATVTESCLGTLEKLFGGPGPFDAFSAVSLRPEPSYWVAKCGNQNEKTLRLLEAVHHLPRPLIVYTTEVEDAIGLCEVLRKVGYDRVCTFHGETKQDKRESIILDWQHRRIDMVVATSAFGLGVDQAEVRAVIHACVPESIDRFYQEVGRGGRDGRASMSLLLYDYDDRELARRMSVSKLITVEKGRPRWQRMFSNRELVPGQLDLFRLPVSISPGMGLDQIDSKNDYNEQWHLRTLTLLCRMGVLEFDWEQTGQFEEDSNENWRIVRMLRHDHLEESFWEDVDHFRLESRRSNRSEFDLMERMLSGEECFSKLFKEIYSIPAHHDPTSKRREVIVATACGGCPACRKVGQHPGIPAMNSYPLQWEQEHKITNLLKRYLDTVHNQLVLFRSSSTSKEAPLREKQSMLRMIRWFATQGIMHIAASGNWLNWIQEDETLSRRFTLMTSDIREYAGIMRLKWKVPTIVIHEKSEHDSAVFRWMQKNAEPGTPVIFLIPETMEHPTRPGYLLSDLIDIRSYRYEIFKQEVGL
ncbi:protein DpdF [Gorillibacterium sp. sgz5001074]|uniref:protein DpdF n=1 Tax=Gorillibacterium sp. sgz5001074 TaxID=3446695 RepID=UPI003F679C60